MANKTNEDLLVEAVHNLLDQDARLGLDIHSGTPETSHYSQFRWQALEDDFALRMSGSPHADSICSAFHSVHSYKYIDHPTFKLTLEKELSQRAVPTRDVDAAIAALNEMEKDFIPDNPGERDAGWNPQMDEIVDATSNADARETETTEPFTGGGMSPEPARDNPPEPETQIGRP